MGQAPSMESMTVFTGTWNLGNEAPSQELAWIPRGQYDIYAIGVQEAIYKKRPGFVDNEQDWFLSVHRAIGMKDYECLAEQTLSPRTDKTYKTQTSFEKAVGDGAAKTSGIRISVYIRKKHLKLVSDVEVLFQTCGRLSGLSGNKGGLCVNVTLGGMKMCFLSSHLAAHRDKQYLERRNQDFQTIVSGLHRTDDIFGRESQGALDIEVLNRHDLVFWFGDLNYRLDLQLGTQEAMHEEALLCIKEKEWDQLLAVDQLHAQQKAGLAFAGFNEAPINWEPTFKLVKGSNKDQKPAERYNPKRVPAYCDRIVWRNLQHVRLTCDEYVSHPEDPMTSDHIPVHASFTVLMPLLPKKIDRRPSKKTHIEATFSELRLVANADHMPATIEDDAPITIRVFHQLAGPAVHATPCAFRTLHWPEPLVLRSSATAHHAQEHPFLFSIRHTEFTDPTNPQSRLGEAMLRWDRLDKSGLFSLPLTQRGLALGTLVGKFEAKLVPS